MQYNLGEEPHNEWWDQLYEDVYDVFLAQRKKLADFDSEYQNVLKNAYRFGATRYGPKRGIIGARTNDTLDIV